ncbi:uncharacterized protein LOC134822231 isoform X2 [Bolinopsis microptera]
MTSIIADKVLKEKGLTWDTPIKDFYGSFKLPGAERTEQVTFKDLFAHKTCLSRSDFWWASGPDIFDVEEMMSKLQFLGEKCEFRSEFKYNNLMYVAGSHIIEKLSNKTWDVLIKEHILDPLGMTNTKTSFKEAFKTGNTLKGYEPFNGSFYELQTDADLIIDLVGQAGSVHSTAEDMNKYMRHIVENNGERYADLFWDQTAFDIGKYFGVTGQITKPTFPASSEMSDYTISWVKGQYEGEEILAHGGDTFTTHTFITLSREREYGIYLSCTGGLKARTTNQLITWFIQDMIMDKEPWITAQNICTYPSEWDDTPERDRSDPDWGLYVPDDSDTLKSFTGTYSHDIFGDVVVSFADDEGLQIAYQKVNCTLKRKKESEKEFRCHASAPSLPSDSRITQDARILNVNFEEGKLYSNMLERGENYEFNNNISPRLSLVFLLLFVPLFVMAP